jgi:pimeloyl-ACP methyl ester carboxylesterase
MDRVPTSLGELAYLDEGTGEVVLLLHGWPVDVTLWRRIVPLLAARFRVVAPDLVLGGDLRDQAAAVRELLAALDVERLAVIGHSHGGGVAQLLALDGPGVDAMVLLDSVAFDVTPPDDLEPPTWRRRSGSHRIWPARSSAGSRSWRPSTCPRSSCGGRRIPSCRCRWPSG